MLIGEYKHTIDAKKRISLPAKFRRELGKKAVITRGLDKCLFVYSLEEWKKVAETLSGLSTGQADSRNFGRLLLAGAVDVEIDSLGRILIPDHLRKYAGLTAEVSFLGILRYVQVWDKDTWEKQNSLHPGLTDLLHILSG